MVHLKSLARKGRAGNDFPFDVPAIYELQSLQFTAGVTFFAGENGSGKSTLLEAIAAATNSIAVGAADIENDETLSAARTLADDLRLGWNKRGVRGFFFRAEDFFAFAQRMHAMRIDFRSRAAHYAEELKARPVDEGLRRAYGSMLRQQRAIEERYGENLDARSHGEGFLHLFQSRMVPRGLYLLDEPEAALSPMRQLAFLSLIKNALAEDCQFIIATHSPILLAFPDAQILDFSSPPIAATEYDELEGVRLMRSFLENREAFLRRL
ncbi:MAG TPA: AAA family ATPase [Abditibacteriaceae bacterium]|jgi:predicted ATPase